MSIVRGLSRGMIYNYTTDENLKSSEPKRERTHQAVLRSTPPRFSIEHFTSTDKLTGDSHHGMHISPDTKGKCTSLSASRSLSNYDIWRSWEDCLSFQRTLEVEYERAAREKRTRLSQGKGVKGFNGLYKKDQASSWASLPSGPDPHSVALDIHEHLPTLTRKGTIFRASQLTIDRRQAELISFIRALFSDDMPTLIKELRVSSVASDFFGLWRSDFDLAAESQSSLTNNVISYFSASHPSLLPSNTSPRNSRSNFSASYPSLPSSDTAPRNSPSKAYHRSHRSTTPRPLSLPGSTEIFEELRYPVSSRRSRSRPLSASSDSSACSESNSDTSLSSLPGSAIADNVRVVFNNNYSDQFDSILEVLPEEQESLPAPSEPYTERKAQRSYSIFGLSRRKSFLPWKKSDYRSVRESCQTADAQDSTVDDLQESTVDDLLDGLGLVLPHPIKEQKFRSSIASISTFTTTDSADAVIPRTPRNDQGSPQQSSNLISTSLSLSDFDSGKHSVPDAFPRLIPSIPEIPEGQETPEVDDSPLPASPSSARTAFNCYPSSTRSAPSATSPLLFSEHISIKAVHDTSIILIRVPRQIVLAEVKQRLFDKFSGQEGIRLSPTCNIVFVPPNSPCACSVTLANRTDVQMITLESDWVQLMSTVQDNKITLRIQEDISTT